MKECKQCKIEIPDSYTSGLCIKCRKHKNYLDTVGKNFNRAKNIPKKVQLANKKAKARQYYKDNKSKIKQKQSKYRQLNKTELSKKQKDWYTRNGKNYYKEKRKNNINYRLKCNLRSRLNLAIKNTQKVGSAIDDLGCSIEELKKHLESQFQEGMSWENYGDWHIDHIRPLASFDLENIEEFKQAAHYTNLQPLWAEENLKKGSSYLDKVF